MIECFAISDLAIADFYVVIAFTVAFSIISILLKKPAFVLAYFFCEFMMFSPCFMFLESYQVYLFSIAIYSYLFVYLITLRSKLCCVIIMLLCAWGSVDSKYGTDQTFFYRNFTDLFVGAYIIFILSLLFTRRIINNACNFIGNFLCQSANSVYFRHL